MGDLTIAIAPSVGIACLGLEFQCELNQLSTVIPESVAPLDVAFRVNGLMPADDLVVLYREMFAGKLDLSIGYPAPGEAPPGLVSFVLPTGRIAGGLHTGPYEDVNAANMSIHAWLAENGHAWAGKSWEIYHKPPDRSDPGTFPTSLAVLIKEPVA